MTETAITKVSTKGQVVIPQTLREEMAIDPQDEFLIYGEKDTIIMKKIARQNLETSFKEINQKLSKAMKQRNITRKDLADAVKSIRGS